MSTITTKMRRIALGILFALVSIATANAQSMNKPLKLFWNGSRGDNFTTATAQGEADALAAGYSFIRIEGYVYDSPQPNTVPLKLFYNLRREDNFTTATAEGARAAVEADYVYVRIEGYVHDSPQPNTTPLKLFWSPGRGDNFTTATAQGQADASAVGYAAVRTEGHVAAAPAAPATAGPQAGTATEVTRDDGGLVEVGNHKFMKSKATLYRNGSLHLTTYTKSEHWTEGLRGRVYVVHVDSLGNAMWVSQVFECKTRGSQGDLLTSSSGTDSFPPQTMPAEVGKYTVRLDIYQGEAGSRDWTASRAAMIDGIKAARDIAVEVKNVLSELQ